VSEWYAQLLPWLSVYHNLRDIGAAAEETAEHWSCSVWDMSRGWRNSWSLSTY